MEAAEVENMDKYKSYIQRRRVGSNAAEATLPIRPVEDINSTLNGYEGSFRKDFDNDPGNDPGDGFSYLGRDSQSETSGKHYGENDRKSPLKSLFEEDASKTWSKVYSNSNHSSGSYSRRSDPELYRRLYGRNRTKTYGSKYSGSYYGSSRYSAEVEDNGATLLAIMIIKQSLACFAVLGLIVLMQKINGMSEVLSFIKKHVVETHVDPKTLLAGVENIVKECARFLGGSP